MNILLVDDEQLELDQLEYMLQQSFHLQTFFKAQDVSEALTYAKANTVHLALIDIHLPGQSGFELVKWLKNTQSHVHIVMVTAYQSFDYAQKALRLKVDNFITKPVVESELITAIKPFTVNKNHSEIIQQVLDYIHNHFDARLTLGDIAEDIHVNHAYLSRKFNEELEVSFPHYLNQYRIEAAKRLMNEKPFLSIAEVSEQCGFNSQHYFSQLFKKELGVNPSAFRKRI
ncbi:Sensory transduction protein LytT [Lentibacillus sp. JNUCC-1]|uniref:response regulator n=1 Tax=Lentibacillus sp. JNUCC-1 TaxID=2654513 RepID=UPI0012E93AD3|nr:response regulator [Lentibacillus sp. JNUCC-1]MUV36797.1 Sensory transduction protein LytT [Lentibacillus sp. JNUCC-1]